MAPTAQAITEKEVDASISFSGEKGWSSDSWSDED